jgi:hypothetical protein
MVIFLFFILCVRDYYELIMLEYNFKLYFLDIRYLMAYLNLLLNNFYFHGYLLVMYSYLLFIYLNLR